jgi:integrase
MKKSLTVASVDRVAPPAKGQTEYFDKGFPGLALRVSYAGGKSFGFYYRLGGKLRRINLGTYPAISLIEAREAWRAARVAVSKGQDPAPRDGVARTDTFASVIAEWVKRDQSPRNRARTLYQLENAIKLDLLPAWGTRRIDTIGKRDVLELLDRIMDRGAVVKARRMYAHLRRFFKWAYGREIIFANPMSGLEKPGTEKARERVLTDAELVAVWNACPEGPSGAAVRLLMLTGSRISEVTELKWSEIDGDTIKLDGSRTKNAEPHAIALSAPARALIDAMPKTGEYVFSTDGGKRPLRGWSHRKEALDAKANIEAWRMHDLRRTVATGLQKLGVNLQTIESVLGHTGGSRAGIVGVYQRHAFLDEARAALETWGAHVTGLIEGREAGKVLPMRRA